jgi:hypothetical protein
MMEAAKTSETLVNFYQTKRRYNPEESNLRNNRRESLKSYLYVFSVYSCVPDASANNLRRILQACQ